jgi:hypothetical protein
MTSIIFQHPILACKNGVLHEMQQNGCTIFATEWNACECCLCDGTLGIDNLTDDESCLNKTNFENMMSFSPIGFMDWVDCKCPSCYSCAHTEAINLNNFCLNQDLFARLSNGAMVHSKEWLSCDCNECFTWSPVNDDDVKNRWECSDCYDFIKDDEPDASRHRELCDDCHERLTYLHKSLNISPVRGSGVLDEEYITDEALDLEWQTIRKQSRFSRRNKTNTFEACDCVACLLRRHNPTMNVTGCLRHIHRDKFADWLKKNKRVMKASGERQALNEKRRSMFKLN